MLWLIIMMVFVQAGDGSSLALSVGPEQAGRGLTHVPDQFHAPKVYRTEASGRHRGTELGSQTLASLVPEVEAKLCPGVHPSCKRSLACLSSCRSLARFNTYSGDRTTLQAGMCRCLLVCYNEACLCLCLRVCNDSPTSIQLPTGWMPGLLLTQICSCAGVATAGAPCERILLLQALEANLLEQETLLGPEHPALGTPCLLLAKGCSEVGERQAALHFLHRAQSVSQVWQQRLGHDDVAMSERFAVVRQAVCQGVLVG